MNILFLIIGLVMVVGAVGAMCISEASEYVGKDVLFAAVALGVLISILATLALCGSTKKAHDNRCSTKVYIVILLVVIIGQAALACVCIFINGSFHDFQMHRWTGMNADERVAFMGNMECGISSSDGAMDCGDNFDAKACFEDCYHHIEEFLGHKIVIVIVVCGFTVAFEFLLLIMAVCIVCEKGEKEEKLLPRKMINVEVTF